MKDENFNRFKLRENAENRNIQILMLQIKEAIQNEGLHDEAEEEKEK